jgi:hypothetical protein
MFFILETIRDGLKDAIKRCNAKDGIVDNDSGDVVDDLFDITPVVFSYGKGPDDPLCEQPYLLKNARGTYVGGDHIFSFFLIIAQSSSELRRVSTEKSTIWTRSLSSGSDLGGHRTLCRHGSDMLKPRLFREDWFFVYSKHTDHDGMKRARAIFADYARFENIHVDCNDSVLIDQLCLSDNDDDDGGDI